MRRRSSINEELLIRRFSSSSAPGGLRLSSALESLSLLVPDDADELETPIKGRRAYGTIEDAAAADDDDVDGVVAAPLAAALKARFAAEAAILGDELRAMISLAVPVIFAYVLELVPGIITLVLVGRMDNDGDDAKLHVDAAALAVVFFNIVGVSTGLGILTALDTLCAAAHGANQPSKMGRYLITGTAVMAMLSCLVGAALCNTTNVLLLFRQPPEVARQAGIFALWMLPGLPFLYAYELLRKLSQARNETVPMVVSAVVCVLVNTGSGYYMVNYTRLGWLGAALARTLGNVSMLPAVFLGMLCTDREFLVQVRGGFRVTAITKRSVSKFLSLGIPGMLQLMLEWVPFEILALECGILPDENEAIVAIGANAISLQISSFLYMMYLGASVAGNVRVRNALGAGDTHRAKMASYLALSLGVFLSLVNTLFVLSYRSTLPSLFTTDEDLIGKARDLLLVVALFQLPDAVNGIDQGIFRAIGKQSLAAKLNAIAYYAVGIPFGYLLGLRLGWGVKGLWFGLVSGLFWGSAVNRIILLRLDWKQISLDAQRRLSISAPLATDEYR
jgi:MATE family multidrug resistance protein